ncbi:hypothetical protein [Paenibacillus sedimenti]|uniref:Uncharacterized protein n=1 Tax=Paenibacillus sedimenti TaxID=2770274 RepID=A0A926KQW6_9BACL|nr:hypothetical protein [Paenibacillus sedimenti]MBD0381832.1 hypothetical protein [Paenibacillus sedimenti]
MDVVNSFLVSLFSWIAILINGIVIFRFRPLTYWKEILMVSIFCSSLSVIIQYLNLIALITFVPPILAIIAFTLLSGLRWVYSLIMIAVGVTVSGLLEFGTTYIFNHFDANITLTKLANDYTVESWYFVAIHLVIALTINQKRFGFTSLEIHRSPRLNDNTFIFTLFFLTVNSIIGLFLVFKQNIMLFALAFLVFIGFIAFFIMNYIRELRA